MLYDPKWEVKVNPFSLDGLILWLENQKATAKYNYADPLRCLLCKYFEAHGFEKIAVYSNVLVGVQSFPDVMRKVAIGYPRTFGAALKRARTKTEK